MIAIQIFTIIVFFIGVIVGSYSVYAIIQITKTQKEIKKDFTRLLYLKEWYKKISEDNYGKDIINEKEKEFFEIQ
ncbi:hypothetical protein ACQ7CX_08725 [Chryseobacterium arthrosphaerae]|uniref:hypothetical protein n=1 Tax=Chryseobacterium arthrosphaerae TaxID=651561 RepID=UPI001BAF9CA1|nr:hypothetical protein [Chryseobacterium arthrosphaerae]QUY56460.1 hypothetical protein I2F65_03730 [Chryseobacterium arthrosphaerae]